MKEGYSRKEAKEHFQTRGGKSQLEYIELANGMNLKMFGISMSFSRNMKMNLKDNRRAKGISKKGIDIHQKIPA